MTPSVSRVSSSGWRPCAEADARDVEDRLAGAGRQAMLDRDVGDLGAAGRMLERAVGADAVVGQREAHIVAAQRIEARRSAERSDNVSAPSTVRSPLLDAPVARRLAQQQRHVADDRIARRRRCRRRRRPAKLPRKRAGVEHDRRCRPAEPHRQPRRRRNVSPAIRPLAAVEPQRRLAEPPGERGRAEPRADRHRRRPAACERIAGPIGQTGSRVGPSCSAPVCSEVEAAHRRSRGRRRSRRRRRSGRRSACAAPRTRPPGNGPSSRAMVLTCGRAVARRRRSGPAPAPGARRRRRKARCRRRRSSARRCAAGAASTRAVGSPPPAVSMSPSIRIRARRPVIGDAVAARDARPARRSGRATSAVSIRDRAAAGEIDQRESRRRRRNCRAVRRIALPIAVAIGPSGVPRAAASGPVTLGQHRRVERSRCWRA